ncbi:MAG: DUF5686 family protein [Bacteroidales bacterium]|jgi:hypothetical protein
MRKFLKYFLILILIFACIYSFAQIQGTKIIGKVTDASSGEPLPFVNIIFKGTTVGTVTDFEGKYSIVTNKPSDTLISSYLGYITGKKPVIKNKFQTINFEMKPVVMNLDEVVIYPGENPAMIIFKKIIKNKQFNNKKRYDFYQYEAYNKIEFDINNIDENFKNKRIFRPVKSIFNFVDTSIVNGKIYLPFFLSESISEIYYREKPRSTKEIIKATKVSGIENQSVSQYLGKMSVDIDIYEDNIKFFEKSFISPIADYAPAFYKYYLMDSTFIGNKWCYKIMFKPRNKQDLAFVGNFWVADTTFAIKKIEMRAVAKANINFINDIVCNQEFSLFENKYWMLTKDEFIVDFNMLQDSSKGFFGKRNISYKNYIFNQPMSDEFYSKPTNTIVENDSFTKSDEYWEKARHDSLTKNEKAIYSMVDSMKHIHFVKTWISYIQMFVTGYKVWKKVELGPYFSVYSFNQIEGNRVRIGGRTSNSFSKKIMFDAYTAYGTKDETYKYGGGFIYMLHKSPREDFGASYKNDLEQLGQSPNAFSEDNIFASAFRRGSSNKLSFVKQTKAYYEKEWFTGFSNTLSFYQRIISPMGLPTFILNNFGTPEQKKTLTTFEVIIGTRFAYQEKFLMGEFERISTGTKYPIFSLNYTLGIKNFLNSEYNYHKAVFSIEHWFYFKPYGWAKYIIEAGKIFNTLPYPLLKLHEGNETYYFDEYSFNMMNYYEFASDEWVSLYYTHHFDGFFLNRIPLIHKLKWREVFYAKGIIGELGEKNIKYSNLPDNLYGLKKPYFEAGVGIENILKILRVDAIWRLSHLDHPDIAKFGVRASLVFSF